MTELVRLSGDSGTFTVTEEQMFNADGQTVNAWWRLALEEAEARGLILQVREPSGSDLTYTFRWKPEEKR